jgi:hypothetical protein
MSGQIARRLKPEEEELLRKREDLAAIRLTLAERELELADLRGHLAAFEGRYLRQVGTLYAELDQWKARLADLRAQLAPSVQADARAQEARQKASETYENSHGTASGTTDFIPTPELKSLFREVAKRIHPDLSRDSEDLARRTRFMAEANRAYACGDAEALQRILDEYQDGADAIEGEGIAVELIRIIRQISMARARVSAIEQELMELRRSAIGLLAVQAEESSVKGRDLLVELAAAVQEQIELARKEYDALFGQETNPA